MWLSTDVSHQVQALLHAERSRPDKVVLHARQNNIRVFKFHRETARYGASWRPSRYLMHRRCEPRMTISIKQLNRATLDRQLLLRREELDVADAIGCVVALQAQEPASPYLALWNRLAGFLPAALDAAFAEQTVVKATLMRMTLHAVNVKDYPAFHHAMLPSLRGSCLGDPRFTDSGLPTSEADALLPHLAEFTGQARTKAEIEDMLEARLGFRQKGVWWAFRRFAPLWHAPGGVPWSFGARPSFIAARAPLPPEHRDKSVQHLVRRYLAAFGPASVRDVAQFAMITRSAVKDALAALAGELQRLEGPDGSDLFDLVGASLPDEDAPAPPRLMAMWDSSLLAYWDRSRLILPDYRQVVIRRRAADPACGRVCRARVATCRRRRRGHGVPPTLQRGVGGAGLGGQYAGVGVVPSRA